MVLDAPPVGGTPATRSGFKVWQGALVGLCLVVFIALAVSFMHPPETPYQHAVSLIKSGKAAAALPVLEELSRQQPDNALLFPWLAQAYLRTDRIPEGRLALDTALRLNVPNDSLSSTVLAYAGFYQSKGDYEEAESLYKSALKACPRKDLSEGWANLYIKWAEREHGAQNVDRVVSHLEAAYNLISEVSDPVSALIRHKLSESYRELAAAAEQSGKDDDADKILEKSLIVSDEPATRMALAAIYSRQKKSDQAIQNYDAVAHADSNNLEARHHLVDLLCAKKDYTRAQAALTELTDKEKSVENFQLLATTDLKLGNYAGAVRAFEDAADLRPKPELLKQLLDVLNDWSNQLTKDNKMQEALAVKGHADRVADQLNELTKDKDDDDKTDDDKKNDPDDPNNPPIALSFSRIWLAKGSLTPEGELKIKNITSKPVADLALTAVFFDHTKRQAAGSVSLPVATPQSAPFDVGASRSLYFSCPNIVKGDHQLSVIIFWKGRLLKEYPVVKL
jgi:tetratricopeptide (TPR) repeat protein